MVICPKDFDRTDAPLEPNATWAILGTDIKGKSIVNQEVTIDCSIGCKLPWTSDSRTASMTLCIKKCVY